MFRLRLSLLVAAVAAYRLPPCPIRVPAGHALHRAADVILKDDSDRQLSSDKLITYASIGEDFKPLVQAALEKLDRGRVMQGKAKYETIDGMIDAYVEESTNAGLNWTREESESEVVRYLQRRALADEGGVDGDGQDKAAFALLFLLLGLGAAQGAQWAGLIG